MDLKEENLMDEIGKKKKKKTIITTFIVILILILCGILAYYFLFLKKDNGKNKNQNVNNIILESEYEMSGNELEDFDLTFLKLENNEENMIYSPLSIKYALAMLAEGANGKTKEQITSILGKYQAKKYANSKNMSMANALFIKNSYKDSIKDSYTNALKTKYNAEVIYDPFKNPNNLNSWVENKTLNLINNLFDDVSELDYALVNALAIDMDWINELQEVFGNYEITYQHEKYSYFIPCLNKIDSEVPSLNYFELEFRNSSKVNSVKIGAVINKYDIVNILGEQNIRKTISDAYEKWKVENPNELIDDFDEYLDQYIYDLDKNYGNVSSSTDFEFYVDKDVKVFAKDLKKYDGRTLQYIGIMPTEENLSDFIANLDKKELSNIISNLKSIEMKNFKEGVITEISGYIPVFKYEYELNLVNDLKKLGVTDIFDEEKADLSSLTEDKTKIIDAKHKANIEFSNEGITAAAATFIGGEGNTIGGFDYLYDVPVEYIDLTFNRPYLYLIRDKDSNEVWFVGTVYEPTLYEEYSLENEEF